MSDRDRPKKSWRELDAMRGKPRPPRDDRDRGGGGSSSGGMNARESKQYRAALDALFAKGEVGKLAEKLGTGPGGRIDPADIVRGGPAPKPDAPAMPSGSSSGATAASAPTPERVATKAPAAAPAPAAPKEDGGRAALRKKVIEALGRDEISRAIDKYVKAHGWPNDFEVLEQALEHNKPERQTEAMTQLEKLLEREKPKRSRTLAGKLRFIEETSDGDLRDHAARIRAKL